MKRLPILVLACVLVSCVPPYNRELSLSAPIMSRLNTEAGMVGPIGGNIDDPQSITAVFYPEKAGPTGVDATRGFFTITYNNNIQLGFLWPVGTGYGFTAEGWRQYSPEEAMYYPPYQAVPMKSGDYIAFLRYANTLSPGTDDVITVYTVDFATTPPTIRQDASNTLGYMAYHMGLNDRCLGMGVYPTATNTADQLYWLVRDPAGGIWETQGVLEGGQPLLGALQINPTAYDLNSFIPDGTIERCFFSYDFNPTPPGPSHGYASFYDSTGWQTVKFQDPAMETPVLLTGVTTRVEVVLSTGRLFSTQDQVGRVYNPEGTGTELSHFDLGNLQFCYEAFGSDGIARVYFSQPLVINHRLYFNVYSIPTTELEGL